MLDFLKFQIFDKALIEYFYSNALLSWVSDFDKFNSFDSEVITTKKIRQYKGIYFCFYANKLEILFRPHYYFNDDLHNANDFKIIDCIGVIKEFEMLFRVDLTELKVVNIEFGVNVISPIDVKDLIYYLAYQEKNEFRNVLPYCRTSYKPNKNGTPNQYKFFKAYAKGIQFPQYCDIDTFRFELKSKQSKYINKLGVYTANDLLNLDVYLVMSEVLMNEFKDVLILDCVTNFKDLKPLEQKKIGKYNNLFFWYKVRSNAYRNCFNDNKKIYHKLINKVENNLKNQMDKLVFEKLECLKKGAISTPKRQNENVQFPQYISMEYAPNYLTYT